MWNYHQKFSSHETNGHVYSISSAHFLEKINIEKDAKKTEGEDFDHLLNNLQDKNIRAYLGIAQLVRGRGQNAWFVALLQ